MYLEQLDNIARGVRNISNQLGVDGIEVTIHMSKDLVDEVYEGINEEVASSYSTVEVDSDEIHSSFIIINGITIHFDTKA